jgi:hypothetical protein
MRGIVKTFTLKELAEKFAKHWNGLGACKDTNCKIMPCGEEYVLLADAEQECKNQWEIGNRMRGELNDLRNAITRLVGIGKQLVGGPNGTVTAVIAHITELTKKLTEANFERQRLEKVNADQRGLIDLHVGARDYWWNRTREAEAKLETQPVDLGLAIDFDGMVFPLDPRTQTVRVSIELMQQLVTKAQAYRAADIGGMERESARNLRFRIKMAEVLGAKEGEDIVLVAQDIVADRNVARTELRAAHRAIDSKDEQIEDLRDEVNLSVARQSRVDNENNDLRTTLRQMNRYAEDRVNLIARLRNTITQITERVWSWETTPISDTVLAEMRLGLQLCQDLRKLCKHAEDPKPTTGETAAANGNTR